MSFLLKSKEAVLKLLPANILSFGYPEGIEDDLKGSTLTVVDVISHKGIEIIADLNEPHDFGEFELVLDPGTFEHCANVAQALKTAMESVKVGGHIVHTCPMTMVNHGFWNYCPELFLRLYAANGFEMVHCGVYSHPAHQPVGMRDPFRRNVSIPPETWALVVGKRTHKTQWKWPRQGIYSK